MSARKTAMPGRKRRNTSLMVLLVVSIGVLVQAGGAAATEQKFVAEGGAVVLSCDLSYDPTKALVWLERVYGGIVRRLPNSSPNDLQVFNPSFTNRVSLVGTDGVDLRIENIGKEDEGSYYCQQEGTDSDGTLQQLIVASPPDPRAPTITGYSEGFLTPGDRLTLTCVSTGGIPPSVLTWWKDGAQLTARSSHTTGQGDTTSVLDIASLQPTDNGQVYECQATQLALPQVEISQVTLSVTYGPQDIQGTCNANDLSDLREGGALECTCTADSNPTPWYSWSYGTAGSTPAGSPPTGAVEDQTAGSLTFRILNRTHSGEYQCTASNNISSAASGVITLNVTYGPENIQVTCDPPDLSDLREGGALLCTCTVTSNPPAWYSWTKDTKPLNSAVMDNKTGTLTYGTLHREQSGKYMCTAHNGIGSGVTNYSILIDIKSAVPLPRMSDWTIAVIAIAAIIVGGIVIGVIIVVICFCCKHILLLVKKDVTAPAPDAPPPDQPIKRMYNFLSFIGGGSKNRPS